MAQTSTTLISSKSHITSITGTDISFTATAGVYTIKSTSTVLTGSGKLAVGDLDNCDRIQQATTQLSL